MRSSSEFGRQHAVPLRDIGRVHTEAEWTAKQRLSRAFCGGTYPPSWYAHRFDDLTRADDGRRESPGAYYLPALARWVCMAFVATAALLVCATSWYYSYGGANPLAPIAILVSGASALFLWAFWCAWRAVPGRAALIRSCGRLHGGDAWASYDTEANVWRQHQSFCCGWRSRSRRCSPREFARTNEALVYTEYRATIREARYCRRYCCRGCHCQRPDHEDRREVLAFHVVPSGLHVHSDAPVDLVTDRVTIAVTLASDAPLDEPPRRACEWTPDASVVRQLRRDRSTHWHGAPNWRGGPLVFFLWRRVASFLTDGERRAMSLSTGYWARLFVGAKREVRADREALLRLHLAAQPDGPRTGPSGFFVQPALPPEFAWPAADIQRLADVWGVALHHHTHIFSQQISRDGHTTHTSSSIATHCSVQPTCPLLRRQWASLQTLQQRFDTMALDAIKSL